jgi:hypothetical protein
MRVLFATYSSAFQNPGGGEIVLLSLKRELQTLGHAVELYNPWKHHFADFERIHYFSSVELRSGTALNNRLREFP